MNGSDICWISGTKICESLRGVSPSRSTISISMSCSHFLYHVLRIPLAMHILIRNICLGITCYLLSFTDSFQVFLNYTLLTIFTRRIDIVYRVDVYLNGFRIIWIGSFWSPRSLTNCYSQLVIAVTIAVRNFIFALVRRYSFCSSLWCRGMGQYFGEKVKFSKLPYYTLLIITFSFPSVIFFYLRKEKSNIEKNISLFVILVLSNHHSDEMLLKNPSHWTI